MARRTKKALTPRWRRRVWNASDPPFSYEMATFYVLAHVPYFICLWVMVGFHWDLAGVAPGTTHVVNEMMFWFRVTAWLMLAWTVALGVSASIPWQRRTRRRLPIIVLAILTSLLLVETAQQASIVVERRTYPEGFGSFEFRYDPATQKWFYQP